MAQILRFILAVAIAVRLVAAPGVLAQGPSGIDGDPEFISPDATIEWLVRGEDLGIVLPGDAEMGCDGLVYVSDIAFSFVPDSITERGTRLAGVIWQYHPATGDIGVFRSPSGMANGIAFDRRCNMVLAEGADFGGRRVTRTDAATGIAEILAGFYEEAPLNAPNDVAIDEQGRIYFTDTRYSGHEVVRQPSNGVYRVDPNGTIERIIDNVALPNGLALSPDQMTLYVSNFGTREEDALIAYDLLPDGTVSFRETVVTYTTLGADGFTVDSEGNLWAAVQERGRAGVYAYTPQGVEKAYIPLRKPWHVSFGRGDQLNVLYITAARDLFRVVVKKQDYHLPRIEEPLLLDEPNAK